NFIGYIDRVPQSAKRDGGEYVASSDSIDAWAQEQISLLDFKAMTDIEKYAVASSLSYFEVDPIDVASIPLVIDKILNFYTFSDLARLALRIPIVIFKSDYMDCIDVYHTIDNVDGAGLIRPLSAGKLLAIKMNDGV